MCTKKFDNEKLTQSFEKIMAGNRQWSQEVQNDETGLFHELAKGQHPDLLWIGCSDSRVPANQITGTRPGDVFVHRNVANVCVHSDMNMLSVLDFAVNILKVKHIIVAGHYGCGGITAAMSKKQYGLLDNWLIHLKDVYEMHANELNAIADTHKREDRFVELNVVEQVASLCKTTIVQNAWKERDDLAVHGMVIQLETGELVDLNVTATKSDNRLKEFYAFE
ncbi:carbonic anhydrase [Albibacterium sp.]|uniref:carbonic anhydrase n=1 Tax=Albibacterium sp. TaxID=2952885 RepID=UPI002C541B99|nr:carbonic anhydrase [Albibacterium sp.]HUH17833.1 carbonic anhydrase [Albibacterium sp.]